MTDEEAAGLLMRAETAEALLAAEREEVERLRAELAVALGQQPAAPKKTDPYSKWAEELGEYVDHYDVRAAQKRSPQLDDFDRIMLEYLIGRGDVRKVPVSPSGIRLRVHEDPVRLGVTVVLSLRGYNTAVDLHREEVSQTERARPALRAALRNLMRHQENRDATEQEFDDVMQMYQREISRRKY